MDGAAHGTATDSDRDRHGRFKRGNNAHRNGATAKAARLAAKVEELASEYEGGLSALSAVDASRLRLAAKHILTAEDSRDPTVATRATRVAELLLSRIRPREAPLPSLQELLAEADE
jgi:hypothetical protein